MFSRRNQTFGSILLLIAMLAGCGGSNESSSKSASNVDQKAVLAASDISSTWIKCADEWEICTFTGTTQVRYGLNGTWVTKTATGSIGCNNNVFGDPLPGADKICEYLSASTEPPPPPPPTDGLPQPVPAGTSMTMSCVDGTAYQCSGVPIRIENDITLTNSGVFAYGRSTSDTGPIVDQIYVAGLAPASGGQVEFRISKSSTGQVSKPVLLLNGLGISWDGNKERPKIIEGFRTTQGRATLNSKGAYSFGSLPVSSNLTFYNYASRGRSATQANYANNNYFPRSGNPVRCPDDWTDCPTVETSGISYSSGNWRSAGIEPNVASADRLHGDGDVHAGNGLPDSKGRVTILPGGSGIGVPFPGSKGYREFTNWNYQYSNLAAWLTHDTVKIYEWTGGSGSDEHNQNRRGMIAYGAVTDNAAVPGAGTATYSGKVYGWYTPNGSDDPAYFWGTVSASVDFATRQVIVSISNIGSYDSAPLPSGFNASTNFGASGSNVANYFTGTTSTQGMSGGLSGRFFGPVTASGGNAPAEMGGSISIHSDSSGATMIAGFIARKR